MAFFNGWPWTQFQEQNLDWLIRQVKTLAQQMPELQQNFDDLKEYVDNYFDQLNVEAELRDVIQEMIDDGTLLTLIMSYVNMDYITPDQFKTSSNTWDQAFDLAEATGKQILIPNHSYDLERPHFISKDMLIGDDGVYTTYGIITGGDLPQAKKVPGWRMIKDPSYVNGFTTDNGTQSWGWNETKGCWIFASVYANTDLHLVEYKSDFSTALNNWTVAAYSDIHGGSVTYCAPRNEYYVAGSATNEVIRVNPSTGVATVVVLPTPSAEGITFFEYDKMHDIFYAVALTDKKVYIFDGDLNLIDTRYFESSADGMLPASYQWQQIAVIDGELYGLFASYNADRNWGYSVCRLDLYHQKIYPILTENFDYPNLNFEAEGIAYNNRSLLIVGGHGPVDFIKVYGVLDSVQKTTPESFYVNETAANNNPYGQYVTSPFNLIEAGIYAAYKNDDPSLYISNCSRDINILKPKGIIQLTNCTCKLTFKDADNAIIKGSGNTLSDVMVIDGGKIRLQSFSATLTDNNDIDIKGAAVADIKACTFTGAYTPAILVRDDSLAIIQGSTTAGTNLARSYQGGVIINSGSNTAGGTALIGDKVL